MHTPLSSSRHPVWDLLRFAVLVLAVTVVLWRNASNFDITEYKAIGEIAIAAVAATRGVTMLNNRAKDRSRAEE